MNNYWSAMITGALIGASVTYFCVQNDDKLSNATRRIKAKSKDALNCFRDMGEEVEELL